MDTNRRTTNARELARRKDKPQMNADEACKMTSAFFENLSALICGCFLLFVSIRVHSRFGLVCGFVPLKHAPLSFHQRLSVLRPV